ncbi:hypothetical protein F4775DRAFT_591242 [Biscogniauxia sp. FL1348]|nr:hypothetical protein F4775DRAFT_591242 [Biscogniauxia sp. FL1348]
MRLFVRHSDDEARKAKYENTTWRNTDDSFYVGLEPPEDAKRLGIIAGGAFNSPQILKLCGFGPAEELEKFNIPIARDLLGEMPDISLDFFAEGEDEDLTEILDGVKELRETFNEKHPCPGKNQNCTDAAQKEYIKLQSYSHHASSTCAIGPVDDRMAVLDSKFRVYGVKNLRAVNTSAFPAVPDASPVCMAFMLPEKASDDILREIEASSVQGAAKYSS